MPKKEATVRKQNGGARSGVERSSSVVSASVGFSSSWPTWVPVSKTLLLFTFAEPFLLSLVCCNLKLVVSFL
jgi:hypothetical protein